MSNVVRILTWIFLCVKSYGLNLTLISSSGSTTYYRGDMISLTCSYTDVPQTATGFELRFNSARLGCNYDSGFLLKNLSYTGALTSPTGSMCNALNTGVPSAYNLTFNFTLTESGDYACYFGALQNVQKSSSPLQLALREKPVNINISVSPSVVFAGDQVTVQCISTGGNPPSIFTYSVGPEIIPTGAFTATRRFNGMLVSCVDIIHSPYLGKFTSVTTSESSLTIYYVEADTYKNTPCANETVLFKVISYLPASITPAYSWMKDDALVNVSELSYAAWYNNGNSLNQTFGNSLNESYTCRVTGLPHGPRNVMFNISWDTSASCVISTITTGADNKTVAYPQLAPKENAIPLQNPKDSEVVYSEVQKGNKGTGRTRLPPFSDTVDPSQVNPERQLIYAEIDHSGSKAERKPPRQNQPVLYAQIDLARTQNMADPPH